MWSGIVCIDVQIIAPAEAAQLANALRASGRRTATLVSTGADTWSRQRKHRQIQLGALYQFFKDNL